MVEATKLPVRHQRTAAPDKTLVKTWAPIERLKYEIEHLFERFGADHLDRPFDRASPSPGAWPRATGWGLNPAFDVVEKDKSYRITAELPGVEPGDIDVDVSNGILSIKGDKKDPADQRGAEHHVSERSFGPFSRSFQLPQGIEFDKVEASFGNGMLTIKLPKSADMQRSDRKIAVKSD